MIDKHTQEQLVENIIASSRFSQSSIYPILLRYLAECSARGYTPKESDIAEKVFNRKDFDASADPLIRVHMSKLRKKLETYFENEGKENDIKISIPARHYNIEFEKNTHEVQKPAQRQTINRVTLVLLVVFIVLCAFLFFRNRSLAARMETPAFLSQDRLIWSDFLNSDLPTIYAIGTVYTYCEYDKDLSNFLIINNPLVNDSKSLKDYIQESDILPHLVWEPGYEVVPKSALLNYDRIQWMFRMSDKELAIKLSTKVEWEDFRQNNILYLGHFHNLGMLKEFFRTKNIYSPHMEIDYQKRKELIKTDSLNAIVNDMQNSQFPFLLSSYLESNLQKIELSYADMDTTLSLVESEDTNYIKDYVVVSKLPGPNNNALLFVISMHQIGRMEVVKMLTQMESYQVVKDQIKQKVDILPQFFELIFQVEGYKETAMKVELLHVYPIKNEFEVQ